MPIPGIVPAVILETTMNPIKTRLLNAELAVDRAQAVEILRAGGLVAVPTETVYGLAADARQAPAVRRIFEVKNRPLGHPLIVHLAEAAELEHWASRIPATAWRLAEAFWPGPLTLILDVAAGVSPIVTGGLDSIALRVPAHPALRALLRELRTGLAAPSANPHKRLSPTLAGHVMAGLGGLIEAVLDGGPCEAGLESTILDLRDDVPVLRRPGPIALQTLSDYLGMAIRDATTHEMPSPGNMKVHYQPRARLRLMGAADLVAWLAQNPEALPRIGLVHHSVLPALPREPAFRQRMPEDKGAYAQRLYAVLHAADQAGVEHILLETPPDAPDWQDVHDRLAKASHTEG